MANEELKSGGFDCQFVEVPPKSVQSECPVCLQILRDPYQATCSGYAFCKQCIDCVERNNKPCPCCNKQFNKFEDKRLRKSLYDSKMHYSSSKQGCEWVGELRDLDNHLNSNPPPTNQLQGCKFSQIKCLHCSKLFLRCDIEDHQSNKCLKRPFSCEYCKDFDSSFDEVAYDHWPVCDYYPVLCTNKCGEKLQRQNLINHIASDCPLTVVDCDFQHIGCKVRLPRQHMQTHFAESIVHHVSLQGAKHEELTASHNEFTAKHEELMESHRKALLRIVRLEQENKQLKQQVEEMALDQQMQVVSTPIPCAVDFTMTNFKQKKKDDIIWHSPPFYTGPMGYKVCLTIAANGQGERKGQYVSASFCLMRGEFDDQLKWPFTERLRIKLLSKDQSKDDRVAVVDFSETTNTGNRVTVGDVATNGYSISKFIPHEAIQNYLQNDSLKLQVSMENI